MMRRKNATITEWTKYKKNQEILKSKRPAYRTVASSTVENFDGFLALKESVRGIIRTDIKQPKYVDNLF